MTFTQTVINNATAESIANLSREGNTIFVSPVEAFGTIAANSWIRLGYFAPGDNFYPTTNTSTEQVKAQNPEGGPDIVLAEETTEASAVYENVAPLTPSSEILALHTGAPGTPMTGAFAGGTISPFTIGSSILARMMVVKKRAGSSASRPQKVFWHPRVGLQNAGTTQKENKDVPQFRIPVLAWNGAFKADLSEYQAAKTSLGAVFTIPDDKLDALLLALADEGITV
ncbi:hypothetical protein IHN63_01965 [Deinococcus sp. 6YEL10]|uniref:hypothetical protein n=1 Tax=Deinococcus sp. 6YEL10 TaxID=2745870 RepID=UPI001E421B3A|nr:hypothetical protein [Deinococcus sp. 6YEL10]MCD0160065.1 hypothetical protein [Deinococcus sp. 6YEL10]